MVVRIVKEKNSKNNSQYQEEKNTFSFETQYQKNIDAVTIEKEEDLKVMFDLTFCQLKGFIFGRDHIECEITVVFDEERDISSSLLSFCKDRHYTVKQ